MTIHDWTCARLLTLTVCCLLPNLARGEETAARPKVTTADVQAMMKSLSNWGRWGDDDQLGALNLITPAKRRQAARLVEDGISISMAQPSIKEKVESSEPFEHTVTVTDDSPTGSASDEYSVKYHGFTQTHMDGLCHLFYRNKLYNGFSSNTITPQGAGKLGVEHFREGVFTKAVMVDLPELFGVKYLEAGTAVYPEHLEKWEKKAGVKIESGDALLIHTGRWARRKLMGTWEILEGSAGLHASCLPWLKERDIAVIGSDLCLDVVPSGIEGFELPVHWVIVTAMGVPILDNCNFDEVSKACQERQRWSFLINVAPLVVPGGTGSPINPIATF